MISAEFEYPIDDKMVKVVANCNAVVNEDVYGLSLTFLDKDDNIVKVEFDPDLFEDLEIEALTVLAEIYYNGEISYSH